MVTITILGTSLVAIMECFSLGLRSIEKAQAYSVAVLLAEEKMNEQFIVEIPPLGETSGDFGEAYPGHSWRIMITPAEVRDVSTLDEDDEKRYRELKEHVWFYKIHLDILWGEAGLSSLSLEALRTVLVKDPPDLISSGGIMGGEYLP